MGARERLTQVSLPAEEPQLAVAMHKTAAVWEAAMQGRSLTQAHCLKVQRAARQPSAAPVSVSTACAAKRNAMAPVRPVRTPRPGSRMESALHGPTVLNAGPLLAAAMWPRPVPRVSAQPIHFCLRPGSVARALETVILPRAAPALPLPALLTGWRSQALPVELLRARAIVSKRAMA